MFSPQWTQIWTDSGYNGGQGDSCAVVHRVMNSWRWLNDWTITRNNPRRRKQYSVAWYSYLMGILWFLHCCAHCTSKCFCFLNHHSPTRFWKHLWQLHSVVSHHSWISNHDFCFLFCQETHHPTLTAPCCQALKPPSFSCGQISVFFLKIYEALILSRHVALSKSDI